MSKGAECIHRFAVEQNIHLDQFARTESVLMVIKGGIPLADTLQFIIEVNDDFTQGHVILYLHSVSRK